MTVSTTVQRVDCPGNSVATTFSFSPVVILAAAELVVTLRSSTGIETVLSQGTLNTNYSLNVTTFPSTGSITYPATGSTGGTVLPTGATLVIERIMPLLQTSVYRNQTAFFGSAVETSLDYLLMVDQQQQEQLGRTIQAAATDPAIPLTLPTSVQRASQLLGFDSSGNPVAAQPSSALVSSPMQPIVNAASTASAIILLGVRRPLTANTTFYVDTDNGTDAVANGLTPTTGAFKTIQFAINTIQTYYDGRGFTGTISVAGTLSKLYNETLAVNGPFVNFSRMTLTCNATLNSVLVLSATTPLTVSFGAELYVTGGFTFTSSGGAGAIGLVAIHGGRLFLSGVTVSAGLGVGFFATRFGYMEISADCHLAGGLTWFNLIQSSHSGNFRLTTSAIVQFDGDTAFSNACIYVDGGEVCITSNGNFNLNGHAVSGQRWRAEANGFIQWVDGVNGTITSIPGSLPGEDITGGRYVYGNGSQSSVVAGTTTYNLATATGATVSFGVGFIPGEIEFMASVSGGAAGMMASMGYCVIGYSGGVHSINNNYCVAGGLNGAQPTNGSCLRYDTSAGNSVSAAVTAVIESSTGGVTLTFTKTGAPAGTLTIYYKARRGL